MIDFFKVLERLIKKYDKTYANLAKLPGIPVKPKNPQFPVKSSKNLSDADSKLQSAFRLIREEYQNRFPGRTFVITEVFRSLKSQKELYAQGRTKPGKVVTNVDGVKTKGKHNYYPSKAIDVAIRERDGKITWDTRKYKPLIGIAEQISRQVGYKVVNGGSWKSIKDYAHFQLGG